VNRRQVVNQIKVIDKTKSEKEGRPRKYPMWMIKAVFLQNLFNLSDPQPEDQLIDHKQHQKILDEINTQVEGHGLLVKRGTIVDMAIIESSNRRFHTENSNNWRKYRSHRLTPIPARPRRTTPGFLAIWVMSRK